MPPARSPRLLDLVALDHVADDPATRRRRPGVRRSSRQSWFSISGEPHRRAVVAVAEVVRLDPGRRAILAGVGVHRDEEVGVGGVGARRALREGEEDVGCRGSGRHRSRRLPGVPRQATASSSTTSFSRHAAAPDAPGSLPPWPGSMTMRSLRARGAAGWRSVVVAFTDGGVRSRQAPIPPFGKRGARGDLTSPRPERTPLPPLCRDGYRPRRRRRRRRRGETGRAAGRRGVERSPGTSRTIRVDAAGEAPRRRRRTQRTAGRRQARSHGRAEPRRAKLDEQARRNAGRGIARDLAQRCSRTRRLVSNTRRVVAGGDDRAHVAEHRHLGRRGSGEQQSGRRQRSDGMKRGAHSTSAPRQLARARADAFSASTGVRRSTSSAASSARSRSSAAANSAQLRRRPRAVAAARRGCPASVSSLSLEVVQDLPGALDHRRRERPPAAPPGCRSSGSPGRARCGAGRRPRPSTRAPRPRSCARAPCCAPDRSARGSASRTAPAAAGARRAGARPPPRRSRCRRTCWCRGRSRRGRPGCAA